VPRPRQRLDRPEILFLHGRPGQRHHDSPGQAEEFLRRRAEALAPLPGEHPRAEHQLLPGQQAFVAVHRGAKRIFERLRDEHSFAGGYTVVKDYVRQARLRHKEVFVPLAHPPGDAQADFGEALVVIGGVEQKAHFLCLDLPHSDDCFVVAFPAENTEAFLEGQNQAFAYWGGVPRTILYDNTRIAVKQITGDVQSGQYYNGQQPARPNAQANDAAARAQLRQLSMQLTGLK